MERHEDAVFALSKLNLDNIEKTIHTAYHQEGPGRPPRSPVGEMCHVSPWRRERERGPL